MRVKVVLEFPTYTEAAEVLRLLGQIHPMARPHGANADGTALDPMPELKSDDINAIPVREPPKRQRAPREPAPVPEFPALEAGASAVQNLF